VHSPAPGWLAGRGWPAVIWTVPQAGAYIQPLSRRARQRGCYADPAGRGVGLGRGPGRPV